MTKKPKFKKRYVLGAGHPHSTFGGYHVGIWKSTRSPYNVPLDFTPELRRRDIPKYRIVLEKVKP